MPNSSSGLRKCFQLIQHDLLVGSMTSRGCVNLKGGRESSLGCHLWGQTLPKWPGAVCSDLALMPAGKDLHSCPGRCLGAQLCSSQGLSRFLLDHHHPSGQAPFLNHSQDFLIRGMRRVCDALEKQAWPGSCTPQGQALHSAPFTHAL